MRVASLCPAPSLTRLEAITRNLVREQHKWFFCCFVLGLGFFGFVFVSVSLQLAYYVLKYSFLAVRQFVTRDPSFWESILRTECHIQIRFLNDIHPIVIYIRHLDAI